MDGKHNKSGETSTAPAANYNVIQMPMSPTGNPSQSMIASFPKPIKNVLFNGSKRESSLPF